MSNRPNIFISDVFNPLYDSLKNIIVENGEIGQLTVREDDSDIIISFAYNDKEDILEMSAMMKMITKFPKKKLFFLAGSIHWLITTNTNICSTPEIQPVY